MATTMFARHKVSDYGTWKRVYDELGPLRQDRYGVTGATVHRDSSDPNTIVVTHRFTDSKAATAFTNSDEVRSAMGNAGVISQPEFWFADDIEQTPY